LRKIVLYKYTTPNWADSMLSLGTVRIGTLFDFRRIEAHGRERGDLQEGMRLIQTDGKSATHDASTAPAFLRDSFNIPPNVKLVFEAGAIIRQEASVPDMYVYCVCDRFDSNLLREFGGDCVRIEDAAGFFDTITKALPFYDQNGVREDVSYRLVPCRYRDRLETWPVVTNYDPVYVKPLRYAYQHEVRAAWSATAASISPLTLTVPDIAKFCARHVIVAA
jgi:hypothetical protein